jgi:hypothetical protein
MWTVDQLISKFRDLTGRPDSGQITDTVILAEINHYYQYIFPIDAQVSEFKGWLIFDTAVSTGEYEIDDSVTQIESPIYINDDQVSLWTDIERFYRQYPQDYDTEGIPVDVLLLDRSLILRPIPDAVYSVKARKTSSTPDALVSGAIDNSLWGYVIAYGAAIIYLMSVGEHELVAELEPGFIYHRNTVRKQIIRQQPIGRRPAGGRY